MITKDEVKLVGTHRIEEKFTWVVYVTSILNEAIDFADSIKSEDHDWIRVVEVIKVQTKTEYNVPNKCVYSKRFQ